MLLYSCWVYCNCGTLFISLVKSKEFVHDTLFAEALEQLYDRQGGRSGSSLECIPPFLGEGHPCSCDVPVALNDESTRELAVSGQCDLDNKLSKPHRVETLQSQTPPPFPQRTAKNKRSPERHTKRCLQAHYKRQRPERLSITRASRKYVYM